MEAMKMDGRLQSNGIGAVMAEEESQSWEYINQAWDDITGEELDPSAVATARHEKRWMKSGSTKFTATGKYQSAGTKPEKPQSS